MQKKKKKVLKHLLKKKQILEVTILLPVFFLKANLNRRWKIL